MAVETSEKIKERIKQVPPEEARDALAGGDAVVIDTRDAINREDARIEGDAYAPAGQGASEAHTDEFAERVAEAAGGRGRAGGAGGLDCLGGRRASRRHPRGDESRAAQPLLAPHPAARGRGGG